MGSPGPWPGRRSAYPKEGRDSSCWERKDGQVDATQDSIHGRVTCYILWGRQVAGSYECNMMQLFHTWSVLWKKRTHTFQEAPLRGASRLETFGSPQVSTDSPQELFFRFEALGCSCWAGLKALSIATLDRPPEVRQGVGSESLGSGVSHQSLRFLRDQESGCFHGAGPSIVRDAGCRSEPTRFGTANDSTGWLAPTSPRAKLRLDPYEMEWECIRPRRRDIDFPMAPGIYPQVRGLDPHGTHPKHVVGVLGHVFDRCLSNM